MNSTVIHTTNSLNLSGDEMLKLGIITMATAGYPDLSMIKVIKKLLRAPGLDITALLGRGFRAAGLDESVDVRAALVAVDAHLDTLPHDDTSTLIHSLEAVLGAIATLFLLFRFIGRWSVSGRIRVDDWMMLVAWILTTVFMIGIFLSTAKAYTCHHIWDYTFNLWKKNFMITWICQLLFCVCRLAIRLSWFLFYWILATMPWFRSSVVVIGVFSILTDVCGFMTIMFQCRPIIFWDDPLGATCQSQHYNYMALGMLGVIQDIMIWLLPIPVVIYTLKLATREKIVVIAMFVCGTIACYAGIIRTIYSKEFASDPDMPYKESWAGFWALVELDLAIVISSVPAVRGLVRYKFPGWFRRNSGCPSPLEHTLAASAIKHVDVAVSVPAQTFSAIRPASKNTISRIVSGVSMVEISNAIMMSVTNVRANEVSLVPSRSHSLSKAITPRRSSDWNIDIEKGAHFP